MTKIYLEPAQPFLIKWLPARVGATGTCADVNFAWTPDTGGEGVGDFEKDGWTFNVFVDEETGRFWYDDERGM